MTMTADLAKFWGDFLPKLREVAAAQTLSTVIKREGATVADVPIVVGPTSPQMLTAGIAEAVEQARVPVSDWTTRVGRDPQKGDVIIWRGRRLGVTKFIRHDVGNDGIFVIDVRGAP